MYFIIFSIFWIVGAVITSFTLIPILIIFFFGIPATQKLEKLNVLKKRNGIIRQYSITILILITVFMGMFFITNNVFPNYLFGILFGAGMALFFGIGKTGRNQSNINDYVQTNFRHFTKSPEEITLLIIQQ